MKQVFWVCVILAQSIAFAETAPTGKPINTRLANLTLELVKVVSLPDGTRTAFVTGSYQSENELSINGKVVMPAHASDKNLSLLFPMQTGQTYLALHVSSTDHWEYTTDAVYTLVLSELKASGEWARHAEVSFLSLFQSSHQSTFSGELAWKPLLSLSPTLDAVGRLGMIPLKAIDTASVFISLEADALLSVRIAKQVHLSAGLGFQDWMSQSGVHFETEGDLSYQFKTPLWECVESVGLRFGIVFASVQTTLIGIEATL